MQEFQPISRQAFAPGVGRAKRLLTDLMIRVAHHSRLRAPQWITAYIIFGMGLVMFAEPGLFDIDPLSHNYQYLARIAPEWKWAVVCAAIGGVRLMVLVIDGVFPGWRLSRQLRAIGVFGSCFFWFQLIYGPALNMKITFALPLYSGLFWLEVWNTYSAMSEIRHGEIEYA